MPNYHIGEIEGVTEGDSFENRAALREAGIHLALIAGIDGNKTVGASSIVLNGGYDDRDFGDEIIYTGHGGIDPNTRKQIANQSFESSGNRALIVSEIKGIPVRVTRGYKHKSKFKPKSGYQYGGLYYVTQHFSDKGINGYRLCRYRLEKIKDFNFIEDSGSESKKLPEGKKYSKRIPTSTLRIVRDTLLSKKIKELYDYKCQICGIRIEVRNVPYAEGSHIRPLGVPHNGSDTPGNIICLCPNHHVMFDKGVFSINNDLTLKGMEGKLYVDKKHKINFDNLSYHREHIFIND